MRLARFALLALSLSVASVALADEKAAASAEPVLEHRGEASYYSDEFQGRKTATGERFSQNKLTAASRTLPLGARVTVINEENGRRVNVKINDRGPYVDGRIIDLSKKAAEKLKMTEDGVAPVTVEARPSRQPTAELKQEVKERAEAQNETPVREASR
jgi:rare lipoprotein A